MAYSDRPWILEGAAVRVSIVAFDDGRERTKFLDGAPVSTINADLSQSADLTAANPLAENSGLCFMGIIRGGPFDLTSQDAMQMLISPLNPNGRPNSDVVRPWLNATDVTHRPRGKYIIDFGVELSEADAALYEVPFEHVRKYVKGERQKSNRATYRNRWWIHMEARPAMRAALAPLPRFIATPLVGKYRTFVWLDSSVVPDSRLIVFARADDYFFGILHSRVHEAWSLAMGSIHGDGSEGGRPVYNNTTCFETFPFPEPDAATEAEIGAAAAALNRLREGWLNPPGADETELKRRTLTNLYNARPTWLAHAHARLDAAVLRAYGWPADLSDDAIVARLLALNLAREPA